MDYNKDSFFKEQSLFILDDQTLNILDANHRAAERYGYARQELRSLNLEDIGSEIGATVKGDTAIPGDRLWVLNTREGEKVKVQFTSHIFKYNGRAARMAIAHEVSNLIDSEEDKSSKYPNNISESSEFPLAEITWDSDFSVIEWSDKAENMFGWPAGKTVGKSMMDKLLADKEMKEVYKTIDSAIENQKTEFSFERKLIARDGQVLFCRWFNSLNYDQDGNLKFMRSLVTDISRRKESQDLFRELAEESLVGVYLIQDGVFQYVNPRLAEIFGYEKDELIGEVSPLALTHPEDRDNIEEVFEKRLNNEIGSTREEFRALTKKGQPKHISTYGFTIDYRGKPAVAGTLIDITKDRRALRRYRSSVKSFRDLFDSVSDAIYILDEDGRFLEVNEGAERMYGYEKDYFVGKTPKFLAAPGKVDMLKTQKYVQKALEGESQTFRWWGKRKNGEVFPKEVTLNPGTYFSKDVVIAIGRDISDRHAAEEEIRKNEEMFRQLFQNSPVSISLLDDRNEVRRINSAFEETFGYSLRELEGLNIDEMIVPESESEAAEEISQKVLDGDTTSTSGTRIAKDGSELEVMIYGVPVIVEGNTIAIYGIYVDVTDRVHAENKVKKSLREKEVLLAEIHHRVKNNLAVITGLLELQSYNAESPDAVEVLRASQMRIKSIALIHEKLYQSENLSEISFDTYIRELIDVIVKSMETGHKEISIQIDSDSVDLTIGQAIPFGLILNELVTNAYKHAFDNRDKGNIDIRIRNNEGRIQLVFEDDGSGIPEDISLDKPDSLGIKLIRTLSAQLEGDASIENIETGGTRFTLGFDIKK